MTFCVITVTFCVKPALTCTMQYMFPPVSVSELKQFKENNGGSPEYAINMCFGEKFPDGKPLEKKLIVVKVTLFSNFTSKTHTGLESGSF